MDTNDKAWLLALAYATTAPKEITKREFFEQVEQAENDFFILLEGLEEKIK